MSRTCELVLLIAVAAIVWSAAIFAQDRPIGFGKDEPGWTSLFNGKDFTGWKIGGPAASFTLQDGATRRATVIMTAAFATTASEISS